MALFAFLQSLACSPNGPTTQPPNHLTTHLRAYATAATHPGPLLLFSDLMEEGWVEGLNALAARGFEITVLHILSPDEVDPEKSTWLDAAPSGDFKLLDVETGGEVEITADFDLVQRYREGLADWQAELRRFCGARGMHYVSVETSIPFEELLFALLRRRAVLR
jgi:hypothetical protein